MTEETAPTTETNPPNGETPAGDDRAVLLARIEAAEREREQYLSLIKSKQAEFENYQKRQRRVQEEESRYACFDLARDLLPLLDNLERATAAAVQAGETGPLAKGVSMVVTDFVKVLSKHGIQRVEPLSQPYDPNVHEALVQQPSAEHPPGTVIHVLAPGYLLHDRVLRPAQVVVSTRPTDS